ncbi:MAG: DNRLRE domain-containing protein [Planctomycetota bacterium]|nr:DNRLRE domain-containing protein [Planctomycetota bacterium]
MTQPKRQRSQDGQRGGRRTTAPARTLSLCQQRTRQALAHGLEPLEARQMLAVSTDEQGWTVFGRSADTRIIYVSDSAGSDANSGLAEDAPVQTLAKARTLLRNGAPDWMLLKRGDVWNETLTGWNRSGRDEDEMMVIGAYGSGARPKLNTGALNGFGNSGNPVAHVALVGIHFHSHLRDTANPNYDGTTAGGYGFNTTGRMDDVLIEDAVFDDYVYNLSVTGYDQRISNFRMRRSVVTDAWSTDKAQGMYVSRVDGVLLEGNVFDHNGWNESVTGAQATVFNHGVYMASDNTGVVLRGNVLSNSSSHGVQARSGGIIEDNVFLRNPINLLFGGGSPTVKPGGVEGRVTGNVFLDSRSINGSSRGTGVELSNIKAGANVVVADNIFTADTHRKAAAITFGLTSDADNIAESVGINDLTIRDNIVYDWHSAWNMSETFRTGQTSYRGVNNVRVIDNDFQNPAVQRMVRHGPAVNTSQLYWQGNRYHSAFAAAGWFQVGSSVTSFNTWKSTAEPTAATEQGAYDDPARSVASYNVSLGGEAAVGAFIAAARANDRIALDGRYTAPALLNYVREGFTEDGIVPGGVATTYGAQTRDANSPDGSPTDPADSAGPGASLTGPPATLTSGGIANHTFTVTYTDASAVDLNSLSSSDVRVTGPNGYNQLATLVSRTSPNNGKTVVAVYGVRPAGAYWDAADNGTYALSLVAGAARDTLGNGSAAADFGTFAVDVAPDTTPPAVTFQPVTDITAAGTTPQTFTLTYTDDTGIDVNTIGTGDVLVKTPGGAMQLAAYVSRQATNNGKTAVAVYTLEAPGGNWESADNGTYEVELAGDAVADLLGRATPGQGLTSFTVDVPWTDSAAPTATASAPPLTVGGIDPHTLTVTFEDETAVDAASVGAEDVIVTGPDGEPMPVTFVGSQPSDDGRTLAAVFSVAAPGGFWDEGDNGPYELSLVEGGVRDVLDHVMTATYLGAFTVDVPPDDAAPAATLSAETVTGAGGTDHTFTVTFTDATGVNGATLGDDDFIVTGPGGYDANARFVSSASSADGKSVTAIYRIPARGGDWDYFDNGAYQVALNDGAIEDLSGNAASEQMIGTFAVNIVDNVAPVASLNAADITTAGGASHSFTVTYSDDRALDPATIASGDVVVTGPGGYSQPATLVSETSSDAKTVVATYSVPAPGGSWDNADNGAYDVGMSDAAVSDAAGNEIDATSLGSFAVNVPAPVPTTVTLTTSTSSYVRDGSYANTKHGTSSELQVKRSGGSGSTREAYVRFDIGALSSVSSAKLRLNGKLSGSGSVGVIVYGSADTTWSESALTWNTKPATNTAALATKTLTSTSSGTHDFDMTAYLQQLKAAGATAVTFVLRGSANTSPYATFRSDEYGTSSQRPQLVVVQGSAPAAVPTLSVSKSTMTVNEGATAAFNVQLTAAPSSNVTVTIARQSGDADLTATPATLVFTPANWSAPQAVTIAAAQDADALAGQATFAVSAAGMTTRTVTVTEVDDDVPPAPEPVTVVSTVSTYVRDGIYAAQNFGTAADLIVKKSSNAGNSRETYLRFDLSAVSSITGAKLRLFGRMSAASTVTPTLAADVYSSTNTTWSETATTWNTKPAAGTTKRGSITIGATTDGWYELDLTAFLKAELAAGRKVVTLALKSGVASDPYLTFASDETANGPQIVVTP